jgi:hypothetical protein
MRIGLSGRYNLLSTEIGQQFSALNATMLLDTIALGFELSSEHVQQAIENITQRIEDEEVLKCVTLAMDVITHPEKNRDFDVTTDGSGPKLGKKIPYAS